MMTPQNGPWIGCDLCGILQLYDVLWYFNLDLWYPIVWYRSEFIERSFKHCKPEQDATIIYHINHIFVIRKCVGANNISWMTFT